ncbi:MAG: isochorismatase family protein [Bradyrhizobium sp.]|uniref:isochorismatase family protein n=1 Tax=Bradyrhizobium sp. TaxID=376 RepID=UPI0011FD0365|nr:isochorismatase family protein [Bradyrhizobium sp.]THD75388.1 MAG: isochorismatase family protein [Bradyrhizobium sp.]
MTSVVSLRTFANSSSVPIVVFVDMQQEYLAKPRLFAISEIDCALDNCRKVLDHSRRMGLPVAFIRMLSQSAFFNRATPFVRWIESFEPCRNEMVFERSSPSCYSSEPFNALVSQCCGGIVLAGFAGESACLSTLIDAFHRNHKVTYLSDASASHALEDVSADEIHRAVSKISGLYGEVYETTDWIASTLPGKLGNRKNAGG